MSPKISSQAPFEDAARGKAPPCDTERRNPILEGSPQYRGKRQSKGDSCTLGNQ